MQKVNPRKIRCCWLLEETN